MFGQEVFIGIGDADAIATYLAGVEQDVVADVDFDPFRATYRRETGSTEPRAPAAETFWEASIQGVGTQTLEWEVEKGTWAAVVMNADASRNVDVDLAVGANIGFIVELGIAFLAGGAVLLLGGATLMFFGTRKRGRNDPTTSKASAPRSRWAWRAATAARAPRFPTKRRM